MDRHSLSARRVVILAAVALVTTAWLAPFSALADTNLQIGGTARIAYANGDDVRLRESPGYDATFIRFVNEGSVVSVLDGPTADSAALLWYQVSIDGQVGYIVADYLALDTGLPPEVATDESIPVETPLETVPDTAELPVVNPLGDAIGAGLIAGTNGEGVRCRAGADPTSAIITVVTEGTIVELIGAAIGTWQPINCASQSGYVHTDFVSYDLSGGDPPTSSETEAPADVTVAAAVGADDVQFESAEITGTAMISGADGGLNCRAGASLNATILTILSDESSIDVRGTSRGNWLPVVCAGQNGYVSLDFVSFDQEPADEGGEVDSAEDAVTGSATVSGTNGDGVRCRTGSNFNASVVVVLDEGDGVQLRGAQQGDWQPVFCGGGSGWIFAQYLGDGASDDDGTDDGGTTGGGGATGSGVISGTNGDGVRCRAAAGFNAAVLVVLSEGSGVTIRGNPDGDWQPVICNGQNGWIFADYVGEGTEPGGSDDDDDDDGGSSGAPSNSDLASGDVASVTGTNGQGVRLRSNSGFNASIITVVPEGNSVDVIDGSTGDWVAVSYNGTSGFIVMTYLTAGAGPADDDEDDGGSSGGGFGNGAHAATTSSLNVRYDPSFTAGIAAVAPAGTVVEVTGPSSNGFYPVDWDGLQGYMSGQYLEATNADLSTRGGSGDPGGGSTDGGGGGGGGSASGSAIANYAMQYLGYPYVWATSGPSSFDCSGFTHWVYQQVAGMEISYNNVTQYAYGSEVSRASLVPGDLVFFQNTYTWGNSHVGIYIGGGQFIHAENASTGVVISSLDSPYYSSRWYGARRLV